MEEGVGVLLFGWLCVYYWDKGVCVGAGEVHILVSGWLCVGSGSVQYWSKGVCVWVLGRCSIGMWLVLCREWFCTILE